MQANPVTFPSSAPVCQYQVTMSKHSRGDEYLPLKVEESEDNVGANDLAEITATNSSRFIQRRSLAGRLAFYISLSTNIILLALLSYTAGVVSRCRTSSSLFEISSMYCGHSPLTFNLFRKTDSKDFPTAPARDVASRNIERKFPHLLDTSLYMQAPSDEVDQAWSDLYNCRFSTISPIPSSNSESS